MWVRQNSPVTEKLDHVIFVDTSYGWVLAGDNGIICNTTNGGLNWTQQNFTVNYFTSSIFFLNRRLGWAIANDFFYFGTTILKTTNGGLNWTSSRYPDTTLVLNTVYYLDSLTGFMGGFQGTILKTTNAGANWITAHVDSSIVAYFPIYKFSFMNSTTGFASGGAFDIVGVVWRTTNGGLNWRAEGITAEPLYDIKCFPPNKVYACGGDFEYPMGITTSTNSGLNWIYVYDTTSCLGIARTFAARTPKEIWIPGGHSQQWMVSTDSGLPYTWRCIQKPDSTFIYAAQFVDSTHGWAVGHYGSIFRYNPAFIGIEPIGSIIPKEFVLHQNYPNPFNPITRIEFSIPVEADVKIKVYDISGRETATVLEQKLKAGKYAVNFNGENFSSGIYFYVMETDGKLFSKKMVLLK